MALPVVVEVPVPWMASDRDGKRNRDMFDALSAALDQRGYALEHQPTSLDNSFAVRHAPAGGYRLAYHSCGDARHVWRLKETPVPFFYSFDRLGFSGWSECAVRQESVRTRISAESLEPSLEFCEATVAWLDAGSLSKYPQGTDAPPVDVPFVFFPMQIRGDVVSRFTRLDPIRVLRAASRAARRSRVPLVVKRHPYCRNPAVSLALALASAGNPYVFVSDASVNRLLSSCGSVLTGNSGVGFEGLLRDKPVYSFALGEYEVACHRIETIEQVDMAFTLPAPAHPLAVRFAAYYLRNQCFDARDPISISRMLDMAEDALERDAWCEDLRPDMEVMTS